MATYNVLYPEGSVVFIVHKAKKGIMERVVIKSYDLKSNRATLHQPVIVYKDTLNGLWNEDDLCSHAKAIEYATEYLNRVLDEIEN